MASRSLESSALAPSSTCTLNIGVPSCQRLTAGVFFWSNWKVRRVSVQVVHPQVLVIALEPN